MTIKNLVLSALMIGVLSAGAGQAASIGSGTITGTFENPTGSALVVSGVGTPNVTTGTPVVGSFSTALGFEGVTFKDQPQGETFVGGFITFRNGTTSGGSFNSIDIVANSQSDDPVFQQSLTQTLSFNFTSNLSTNTPEQNADTLFFTDQPELGGFSVLEEATGVVELLLFFNSLELSGFGDVLTPNTGFTVADPFAPVDPSVSVIPLPATLPLLLAGLGALGLASRRQRRTC